MKKKMLKAGKVRKGVFYDSFNCWQQTDSSKGKKKEKEMKEKKYQLHTALALAKLGIKKIVHWSLKTQGERRDIHLVFVDEVEVDA